MKKLNQKGFTHHLVMFVILAVVLGAMGFAGYRVWQNKNIDAKAAGWTRIPNKAGGLNPPTFTGCKSARPVKRVDGKTYHTVRIKGKRPRNNITSFTASEKESPGYGNVLSYKNSYSWVSKSSTVTLTASTASYLIIQYWTTANNYPVDYNLGTMKFGQLTTC